MKAIIVCLIFGLLSLSSVQAQEIRVKASKQPLSEVLEHLGVDISFNSRALSVYPISLDRTFKSPLEAITFLLSETPYQCEVINKVYVISPRPTSPPSHPSPPKPKKKETKVKYQPTTIAEIHIGEITITAPQIAYPLSTTQSGEIAVGGKTAKQLPGSLDNATFNLLRLLPGVRASGEPSDELIVWSSSSGESRIFFDQIPLFGMKGFNDNISFINPYLVNKVKLLKGGYDASYGNQTGAITEIETVTPDTTKLSLKGMISTLTANLYGSVPIGKRSALSVAYRRTFYDLYDSGLFNPYNKKNNASQGQGSLNESGNGNGNGSGNGKGDTNGNANGNINGGNPSTTEWEISPSYFFNDLNITYAGYAFDNDTYRFSFYNADDQFKYTAQSTTDLPIEALQHNKQLGASATYHRQWNSRQSTKLSSIYSQLNSIHEESNNYSLQQNLRQFTVKADHQVNWGSQQTLNAGMEYQQFISPETTFRTTTAYLSNQFVWKNLSLKTGIRTDFTSDGFHLQPRFSLNYDLSSHWKAGASWGLYRQYISRLPEAVSDQTFVYHWGVHPNLQSMHTLANLSYRSDKGFSAHVEGYLKKNKNAIRLIDQAITSSDEQIIGLDLLLKQSLPHGTLFGSYSVSSIDGAYQETGQEIKLGAIYTIRPFVLSTSFVYGTGFTVPDYSGANPQGKGIGLTKKDKDSTRPYSRWDLSAVYRFTWNTVQFQAGGSLINLLNTENLKYSYTIQEKSDPVTFFSTAMPFTPMLFFEVIW